jgi:hypothetical protein
MTEHDSKEHGLITKIWGPALWKSLHSITFAYPINPTAEDKTHYKNFFLNLGFVMPCKYCRDSYQKFIGIGFNTSKEVNLEPSINELNDAVLENRTTLTKWLYNLHNRVNDKLGVDYKISYEDVVTRYEMYRAKCNPTNEGCMMPLDLKAESFKISDIINAPVIDYKLATSFAKYAEKLGIKNFKENVEHYKNMIDNKLMKVARDNECIDIIHNMRINAIPILDPHSKLPTFNEMKLIMRLCSNISKPDLEKIVEKLHPNLITSNLDPAPISTSTFIFASTSNRNRTNDLTNAPKVYRLVGL